MGDYTAWLIETDEGAYDWTLGGLVQRQWRIYQAWMYSPTR